MSDQSPQTRKKKPPVVIPLQGEIGHNAGIYLAIGSLVVSWANSESVFLAMLQAVIRGDRAAANIVWYSQRTTKARLDLLGRLCREQIREDTKLLADVQKAIRNFHGLSGVRNLYCHGTYAYDERQALAYVVSVTAAETGGKALRSERKTFNRATLNEIGDAIRKLAELNRHLWELVPRLESALGVPHTPLPRLPRSPP